MPELDIDLWLKPGDIKDEDVLTFIDAGKNKIIPAKEDVPEKEVFEIGVQLPNGQKRLWTINETSQRAIASSYTTNSDAWVGKTVVVFKTTQNVKGNMKEVIYARIPIGKPEETVA